MHINSHVIFFAPYPTFAHLNVTIITSVPHVRFGEDTQCLTALRDNAASHLRDVDATRAPLFFFFFPNG